MQNAINYESEEGEYPRYYTVETLVDEAGDCEDFSILGASILKIMGIMQLSFSYLNMPLLA